MVRECVASLLLLPVAGCSLFLDFSDNAIPKDAQIDGPYTQAECEYKEPNESATIAAAITSSDTGPAAICAGGVEDHDFYRFTVPAMSAKVEIRISYTFRPGGDIDLRLYDSAGTTVLSQSHNFSNEELIACPGSSPMCLKLAAGDYVFEVFPGTSGAVNSYTFSLAVTPM
jgi:hypothetical protein